MTLYNKTFGIFDNGYFGYATIGILGQSCLGGIAAMAVLANGTSALQMFQLTLIVLISMLANTFILAQMKHKVVFNMLNASVIVNLILILLNHL
ncbi:hypothetical protein [Flavobacterium sp. UMI-01]|uniref:hypothetical protein n=1 Tax=Flavobacterium sp. UMI-01 TaxID=1441053 RepID=UPI001C7D82B5|nr:hypothetical protein [Flavobacterium sp. UMI-01]GIZ07297.1 hypothetical protein FUMI01_00240 [Flavobacterium sp. UMI-01]